MAAWLADVHPNPYLSGGEEAFRERVVQLAGRADDLGDEQFLVELMRLLGGRDRDGHTGVIPFAQDDAARAFPIALYNFDDGMFVIDARPPYEHLIGAELVAIGETPLADAVDRLVPLISRDNAWTVRARLPAYLVVPEVLEGVGLLADVAPVLTFRADDGNELGVDPEPISMNQFNEWRGLFDPLVPPALPLVHPALNEPEPGERFWTAMLGRTLYAAYDQVQATTPSGSSVSEFAQEIDEAVRRGRADRVVLDVRRNPGGNNGTYGPLLSVLQALAADVPGSVVVLVGRSTFSAAGNFVTELRGSADVTLIGEPMGASPNLYGDAAVRTLAGSGIVVNVATREWTFAPDSEALTITPDIAVPTRWADYRRGIDAVVDAALETP